MCCALGVSPSGYYAWRERPLSKRARTDVKLSAEIQAIRRESRGTYGVPRIHAKLAERGIHVGRKRVARLMRGAGLQGVSRRKAFRRCALRPRGRHPILSRGTSRSLAQTSCGSPISRTYRRGRGSSIWPSSSMRGVAA
jgi:hypothetical protein